MSRHVLVVAFLWAVSYHAPTLVALASYSAAVVAFLVSDNDAFWYTVFLVIIESPGDFFTKTLPMFSLGPHLSVGLPDLFLLTFLAKAAYSRVGRRSQFSQPVLGVLAVVCLSFVISAVAFPFELGPALNFLRPYAHYTMVFAFPLLIRSEKGLLTVFKCLFVWTPFIVVAQVVSWRLGSPVVNLLVPQSPIDLALSESGGAYRPLAGGFLLVFFSFVLGLALLASRNRDFRRAWLWALVCLGLFSALVSGTRSWVVLITAVAALAGFSSLSRLKWVAFAGVVALVPVMVLEPSGSVQQEANQFMPLARVAELARLGSRGIGSIDTAAGRLEQAQDLIGLLKESPIVGWGFSTTGIENYDCNVGIPSTLMLFGAVGVVPFLVLIFFVLGRLWYGTEAAVQTGQRGTGAFLRVLCIGWGALVVGYFTTQDMFTWYAANIAFGSLLMAVADLKLKSAWRHVAVTAEGRGSALQRRRLIRYPTAPSFQSSLSGGRSV